VGWHGRFANASSRILARLEAIRENVDDHRW
jgi:hypothetical protein